MKSPLSHGALANKQRKIEGAVDPPKQEGPAGQRVD